MVDFEKIESMIASLKSHIESEFEGFIIIRAEQGHKAPAYPYGSFKVINSPRNFPHQDAESIDEVEDDTTKAKTTLTGKRMSTVSLSFLGTDYTELYSIVDKGIAYLQSSAGKEAANTAGISVEIPSPTVQDRTTLSVNEYEHKLGFDFELTQYKDTEIIDDAVDESTMLDSILES